MGEVCSEQDVEIQDNGMMNVKKKNRLKHFDGDDSTMEESIGQSEAYHTESGEQNEASDKTAPKAILRGLKQKRIGSPIFDAKRAVQNKSIKRAQSRRCSNRRTEK